MIAGVVHTLSPLAAHVPSSKSIEQRVRALDALAKAPAHIVRRGSGPAGEDVRALTTALAALGRHTGRDLGASRASLALDLGLGATGYRLALALATLRPPGARTRVTGRPGLLRRPHAPLVRALQRLGGHVRRRRAGSHRVLGGGVRGGRAIDVDATRSSQYASALATIAPRIGGLVVRLRGPVVSAPYLGLTVAALEAFGIAATLSGTGTDRLLEVPAGEPAAREVVVPPDASAAAARYAAAALTGEVIVVPGLRRDGSQPDLALLDHLEAMGARVDADEAGDARVRGPGGRLRAAGTIDLRACPDLLPLVAVLAATAEGTTRLVGAAHVQHKESDRRVTVARGLAALGGRAEVTGDGLVVHGTGLGPGTVEAAGDHRLVFAFGVLARQQPGIRILGRAAADKSDPCFLADVLGTGPGEG